MTRLLRIVALGLCVGAISSPGAASALSVSVSGNRLVDDSGHTHFGWAWDAKGGWTCHAGPSLIQSYRGKPTGFGVGFRDHLLKLGRHARR